MYSPSIFTASNKVFLLRIHLKMRNDYMDQDMAALNKAREMKNIYKLFFDNDNKSFKIQPENSTDKEPLCYVDDTRKMYFRYEGFINFFYNRDNTSDYIEEDNYFNRYLKIEYFNPANAIDFA